MDHKLNEVCGHGDSVVSGSESVRLKHSFIGLALRIDWYYSRVYSTEPGGEMYPELLPLGINLQSEDVDCPMLSFY